MQEGTGVDQVNADFSVRVVIDTQKLPWIPSPQTGVERRLLDRIGGEVARATSIVRYAPNSAFPAHTHGMGEEFLVLDGVFADEHGDYPAGTYVRNPPGTSHIPSSKDGCTILVKLRQMTPEGETPVVIHTNGLAAANDNGGQAVLLYKHPDGDETVTFERLASGVEQSKENCEGGEEIYVISGTIGDHLGNYGAGTWIRNPDGFQRSLHSRNGATIWRKHGHLTENRLAESNV